VLRTFASHRALARLFMVEALGAGREFHHRMAEIRQQFAGTIALHLEEAVTTGLIAPLDTATAARAWFGALNEVLMHWVLSGQPKRLEDAYTALRPLLMRSVGVSAAPVPSVDKLGK
jgi:TetR/AcrR family transcriptional regulator, fatty acid metabolism regulator protein